MKHVFVVNSHTSFLVAIGVIEYLMLERNNVLLLMARHYYNSICEIPYKTVDISKEFYYKRNTAYSFRKRRDFIRAIDNVLEKEVNDNFLAYVPHTATFGLQVIVSNKSCQGINLCQESARTFFDSNKSVKYYLKKFYFSVTSKRIWAQDNWMLPNWAYQLRNGVKTYSFVKDYFLPLRKAEKHLITIPKINLDINIDLSRPFFIFEGVVEQREIEPSVYFEGCQILIDKYGEDKNYVKFHPSQNADNRRRILYMFNFKEVELFPEGVPFELLLMQYKGLKVYGFNSSLIMFAKAFGHNVISETDLLTKKSKKFRKYTALK